jgi:hypothetical protein
MGSSSFCLYYGIKPKFIEVSQAYLDQVIGVAEHSIFLFCVDAKQAMYS